MYSIKINNHVIDPYEKTYIVAEIGANHNGDMELCRQMIDSAIGCGVDAIKFQSWTGKSLISKTMYDQNPGLEEEIIKHELSKRQHQEIASYCASKGVTFCSTPFSKQEVNMLDDLGVPFFKVASMDLNNIPFLRYIAKKNKPMIISTGMGTLGEIEKAINAVKEEGNNKIILLHCVSQYPPEFKNVNLRNIEMLSKTFECPVGFSDHTIGTSCPLAAVALGACIIEKHFTIDKKLSGWDHAISADPHEMKIIVNESKNIVESLGQYMRYVSDEEIEKAKTFRRSIVVTHGMKVGDVVTEKDLDFKRPGTGIRPDEIQYVINRKLTANIDEDEMVLWKYLE